MGSKRKQQVRKPLPTDQPASGILGGLTRLHLSIAAVAAILAGGTAAFLNYDQLILLAGIRGIRVAVSKVDCSSGDAIRLEIKNHEKAAVSVSAASLYEIRRGVRNSAAGDIHVESETESILIPAGESRVVKLRARIGGAAVDFPHAVNDACRLEFRLDFNLPSAKETSVTKECECSP